MLLKNNSKRLLTITEPLDVVRDSSGKVTTATGGAKYDLLPAGEAVSVPDSLCASRFVKALIESNQIIVMPDDNKEGDDGEFDLHNKTKAELIEFAKQNKIDIDSAAKKAEILAEIKTAVGG
jgi:adenylate kinase family enzyme